MFLGVRKQKWPDLRRSDHTLLDLSVLFAQREEECRAKSLLLRCSTIREEM
jgi:hypothetical protein